MLHFFQKNKEKYLQISLSKYQWCDLQLPRYRAKHTEIGNFKIILPLPPLPQLKPPKIKILKNEKISWRYHHFACDHWFMVPEIKGATDINFCHFGSFLALSAPWKPRKSTLKNWKKTHLERYYPLHICNINDSHMTYGSSDMESNRQNFLSFWTAFCLFALLPSSSKDPENQNFEKMKKTPEDILIS